MHVVFIDIDQRLEVFPSHLLVNSESNGIHHWAAAPADRMLVKADTSLSIFKGTSTCVKVGFGCVVLCASFVYKVGRFRRTMCVADLANRR